MQDFLQIISLQASGLSSNEMFVVSSIVLVASVIRGYAGFGFSAIVVAGASLFLPTREVVPLVLLLEIIASLQMATQVWRHVNWRMVLSILAASILFIPLGQYVLLCVEIEPMRAIAVILLLAAVVLTATGRFFPVKNDPKGYFLIGTVSGFMNGLLAGVAMADDAIAGVLQIEVGQPVLKIEMLSFTYKDKPYEYRISYVNDQKRKMFRQM